MTTIIRPLRRDAAENRTKILAAAAQVFAERGLDGGVDEVARVAGVGMGTIYRRFATKQALIDELVGSLRRVLLAEAQTSARLPDGLGLEDLLLRAGELQMGQLGCLQRLWNHSDAELESMQAFRVILAQLLRSAQERGRVRAEVTTTDVSMLLWSVRGVIEMTQAQAPRAWRRHLELLVAGLRPVTEGPFAQELKEKPLTETQARRVTYGANSR